MGHGHRNDVTGKRCPATGKVQFTSYRAAYRKLVRSKDVERIYNGKCCGFYHITGMTEEEAQVRLAGVRPITDIDTSEWQCTFAQNGGSMGITDEEDSHEEVHTAEGTEPKEGTGGSGASPFACGRSARPTPSPAEVARRLQARSA